MYIKKRTIIYFLVVFIFTLFGLSLLYNFYSSDELHRDTFAGQIILKTDQEMVIKNVSGETHTIDLQNSIQVYQGRKEIGLANLATDTFVIVELATNKIFLLDPKKKPFK